MRVSGNKIAKMILRGRMRKKSFAFAFAFVLFFKCRILFLSHWCVGHWECFWYWWWWCSVILHVLFEIKRANCTSKFMKNLKQFAHCFYTSWFCLLSSLDVVVRSKRCSFVCLSFFLLFISNDEHCLIKYHRALQWFYSTHTKTNATIYWLVRRTTKHLLLW